LKSSKWFLALLAPGLVLSGCATLPPRVLTPNVVQDWKGEVKETFAVSNASKSQLDYIDNSDGRLAQLTYTILKGDFAGFWQGLNPNNPADLSKARTLTFKAMSTAPGDVQIQLRDAYNLYYLAYFKIPSTEFSEVTIPVSAFTKNTNYTPPDAVLGHGMDLKQCSLVQFALGGPQKGVLLLGPISYGTTDPYLSQYPDALQKYRAAGGNLSLPEEARKCFVQAEDVVNNKDYNSAVNLYYKGLEAASWFPKAHYNLAILLAEHQQNYPEAVAEMKRYLELDPNAPDARAAQDKIYVWEGK
jgi:tetratricopeptide (TPR) repeat protein